jgi:hypothetical protein
MEKEYLEEKRKTNDTKEYSGAIIYNKKVIK